jgi:hypothetical protein
MRYHFLPLRASTKVQSPLLASNFSHITTNPCFVGLESFLNI